MGKNCDANDVIITLQDHKLAKSRNFGSPRRKKFFLNNQYFYKNCSLATKLDNWEGMIVLYSTVTLYARNGLVCTKST